MKLHIIFLEFDRIADLLIRNGADVNIVGPNRDTALILAVRKGRIYFI